MTYTNASNTPTTGERSIEVRVNDGDLWSTVANAGITVSETNDTPTIVLESQPGTPEYVEDQQGDDGRAFKLIHILRLQIWMDPTR